MSGRFARNNSCNRDQTTKADGILMPGRISQRIGGENEIHTSVAMAGGSDVLSRAKNITASVPLLASGAGMLLRLYSDFV